MGTVQHLSLHYCRTLFADLSVTMELPGINGIPYESAGGGKEPRLIHTAAELNSVPIAWLRQEQHILFKHSESKSSYSLWG